MTIYIENVVKGFSRYHKYTLWTDLRDISRSIVRLVVRANSERDRLATLVQLRDTIEEFKVTVRVCKEVTALVEKGVSVVIIKETDRYIGKIKDCLPVKKIVKREG